MFLKTQNFLTFDFGCLFRIVLYYNLLTVFICFSRFCFVLLRSNCKSSFVLLFFTRRTENLTFKIWQLKINFVHLHYNYKGHLHTGFLTHETKL